MEQYEILDLLTSLVERNLVVVDESEGEVRYRCLESVRQYAAERLAESELSGEAEHARDRQLAFFLHLAEEAAPHLMGPEQADWLRRVGREHDNLRTSFDWCLQALSDAEPGLRLGGALHRYFHMRGNLTEGRRTLDAVLRRHAGGAPSAAFALALHGAGNLAYFVADYAAAREYFEQSLSVRRQLGDRRGVAGSLGSLGNVAHYSGDYATARAYVEESLAINRETGNRVWEAVNLTCLANLTSDMGDLPAAHAYYEQAVPLNHAIGNRHTEAICRSGLGLLLLREGDAEGADREFEQALEIAAELGSAFYESSFLANRGMAAMMRGDLPRAVEHYRRSIKLSLQCADEWDRRAIVSILEEIAPLLLEIGVVDAAVRLQGTAEAQREALKSPMLESARPSWESHVAAARSRLSPEEFAAARVAGSTLTLAEALELAAESLPVSPGIESADAP